MVASPVGSQHWQGAIRVVPETDEIVAICLEGEFDLANAPALGDVAVVVLASIAIALFATVYPSRSAAALTPVEAIRHE